MFPSPTFRNLPRELMWKTETVGKGETLEGCIAGPCVGVNTHFDGTADRACRAWASGGVLECMACLKMSRVLMRGYQPLITKDSRRLVVLLSETVYHKVKDLRVGTPVRFTRPKKGKRPLEVTMLSDDTIGSDFVRRMKQITPHTIFEYLCHLWQDCELTKHFGFEHIPSSAFRDEPEPGVPTEAA